MEARLQKLLGVVVVTLVSAAPHPAAPQTESESAAEPAQPPPTGRISSTFELLESVATDGRADPLFGSIDGRRRVRVVAHVRCTPRSHRSPSGAGPPEFRSMTVSWDQLDPMADDPCIGRVEPARLPGFVRSLEVTTQSVGAPSAHRRPADGTLGSGQTIALLDSPVDLLHPAFFRPDGGRYSWIDVDGDGAVTPKRDAIDLDGDGEADPDETLRVVDVDAGYPDAEDGTFEPRHEWLYADQNGDGTRNAGARDGFSELDPAYGEATFVADDVDRDGRLEPRENLYRLDTSKLRRMVRGDRIFVRGENLIEVTENVSAPDVHGTAVAGILVGGPAGFHDRVGVAPRADLVVYAHDRPFRPPSQDAADRHLEALRDAAERGIGTFVSEWTNPFLRPLDGSSNLERAMERARSEGLVQVVPAGNLNRSGKHLEADLSADAPSELRFRVPRTVSAEGTTSRVKTVFGSLQWSANPNLQVWLDPPQGEEERLDAASSPVEFSEFDVRLARSQTPRKTHILTFYIRGNGETPSPLPDGDWRFTVRRADESRPLYGRITDAQTGWAPGVGWVDPTRDRSTISYPATSDAAVGVAAHAGRSSAESTDVEPGDLRPFSGRGPRLGGARAVDLSGPDNAFVPAAARTFAADRGRRSWFRQFGGTSSAAPHVAGGVALLRSHSPDASPERVVSELLRHASSEQLDPRPDSLPDPAWGYGRLSMFRALYDEVPPSDNRPPEAALDVRVRGDTVEIDASESRDPEGDPLEFRFDSDHDGDWDGPWTNQSRAERTKSKLSNGSPRVARVDVRDPHGARSGALASLPDPGASTADADVSNPDGGDPPERRSPGCRTAPSPPAGGRGVGLLVFASLVLWRRFRREMRADRRAH